MVTVYCSNNHRVPVHNSNCPASTSSIPTNHQQPRSPPAFQPFQASILHGSRVTRWGRQWLVPPLPSKCRLRVHRHLCPGQGNGWKGEKGVLGVHNFLVILYYFVHLHAFLHICRHIIPMSTCMLYRYLKVYNSAWYKCMSWSWCLHKLPIFVFLRFQP